MKIGLTHPYSWPEVRRGAERIIMETARALAHRGHDVTILTSGAHSGVRQEEGVTVRVARRILSDNHQHERWFGWRIMPRLVASRFDVVHSLMPYDALAAIRTKRLAGHRTVYEELGIPIVPWWADLVDHRARLAVARKVDAYGCMSRFALDALHEYAHREGVLIPGGVRVDEFAPAAAREVAPTVLFSGVLDEPRKGVALLLDAIAQVAEQRPDVQLWLSGPGDATAMLQRAPDAARARTTVLPLGEPHEQGARYGAAWVTALPSINESFGMVLLESLACGTPIVVANHSAPPELVTEATGAICEPDDVASLSTALRRGLDLANDPATVTRCRESAIRYDWDESIAPQLEAIYTDR
jgi:phosphatidylinositol alpha-mannosyltransferase